MRLEYYSYINGSLPNELNAEYITRWPEFVRNKQKMETSLTIKCLGTGYSYYPIAKIRLSLDLAKQTPICLSRLSAAVTNQSEVVH